MRHQTGKSDQAPLRVLALVQGPRTIGKRTFWRERSRTEVDPEETFNVATFRGFSSLAQTRTVYPVCICGDHAMPKSVLGWIMSNS